jgi:uncharacterized protein (TIGR02145 family)
MRYFNVNKFPMKRLLDIVVIMFLFAGSIAILHSCKKRTVPEVTTAEVSGITQTNAVSGGNVTNNGGAEVTARGVCWNTAQNPSIANSKTSDGTGNGIFTSSITGLTANTTYYIRAYATNSEGTNYGNEVSFATLCTVPSATTNAATSLANTTATLNGTVNANGCSTTVTFDYGLTASYGSTLTAVQSPVSGTTLTSVSVGITGLASGQTYHYRVKAVSTGGPAYGGDILFTTTVNDKDGNVYNTVTIGTQVWMKENLKTMKYNDGTSIPNVTVDATWAALTTPAYCWYNNNAAYKPTYGALYNWYTVNTGKLCPAGWHVPTEAEWTTLTDYLGGASVAGGKLKESGTAHWSSPNTGATNESGFTALPGGWRNSNGTFYEITNFGIWLSSTEFSAANVTCQYMGYYYIFVDKNYPLKSDGHSVRCVRD